MPWIDEQRADGMLTWEPVQLPQELLDQLLDCLRVPLSGREAAALGLRGLFSLAAEWHRFEIDDPKREEARKELARLARATAAYREELDQLGDVARTWLGTHALRREWYGDVREGNELRLEINDLLEDGGLKGRERYDRICSFVDDIGAASTEDFWDGSARQSKAPFGRNGSAFEEWFCVLCHNADQEGWALSVSPPESGSSGTGTIVQFLELAKSHLPVGFVPQHLNAKRLQRLRHNHARQRFLALDKDVGG